MLKDLLIILYSWLLLSSFQIISIPLLRRIFGKELADRGWGVGRIVGWLMVGVPIWFIAHAGIPINSTAGIWMVMIAYVLLWLKEKRVNSAWLLSLWHEKRSIVLTMEILFLFGIVFLSVIRGYNPDINGLEKFMDAGLMQSYMVSPTLPIQDMWLAGEVFNYYTFGHYLGSITTRLISQPLSIGYNINLGFLMGLTLIESASVVINLISATNNKVRTKISVFAGTLGAFLVTFGGNTQASWYFLKNKTFVKYWYPDATRFIVNTIHEFPAYSFIVSDLHAHVWTIPIVLLSILAIFTWSKKLLLDSWDKNNQFPWTGTVVVGALLGIMLSTSTWSGIVYTLFLSELSLILLIWKKFDLKLFINLVQSAVVMIVVMVLISSPWWLHFESISEGVRLVTERSPFWQLIVLWIGHASISLLAGFLSLTMLKKKTTHPHIFMFIIALVLSGITTLILPEIIYFKDIYTTQPRANTMFKLTFEGFVMMSLLIAWTASYIKINMDKSLWKKFAMTLILLVILAVGIYPYFGYRDFYLGTKNYRGLNGLSWLELQHPNDYAGIEWLKALPDRPVILEAVGDSYTTFARVSSFSGKPTVLGWRVHEWLWRGGYDIPGQRSGEVERIYNFPTSAESQQLLNQYKVQYIFVGDKEKEAYPNLNDAGIQSLGKIVFKSGKTYIIER